MRGASAGALTATLAACSVNVDKAFDCAQRLAQEHRLFERSIGLTGKPLQNAHVIEIMLTALCACPCQLLVVLSCQLDSDS